MNTTERLAFRLVIAEPNTDERTITVCPRYDNLKLKWSRPTGQMYYTEDISGTLKFLGVDFQTINACALNTQFTLIVYQNRVEVGRSLFRKTDCKWDIDHGVVEVDISVYDEYKKFQDKKDEEYNLVKLGINKHNLNLKVYPQNQIYFQDDSIVSLYGVIGLPAQPSATASHNHASLNQSGFTTRWLLWVAKHPSLFAHSGIYYSNFTQRIDIYYTDIEAGVTYFAARCGTIVTGLRSYELFIGRSSNASFPFSGEEKISFILKWINGSNTYYTDQVTPFTFDSLYSASNISIDIRENNWRQTGTILETVSFDSRVWVPYSGMATGFYVGSEVPGTIGQDDVTASFNHNYKFRISGDALGINTIGNTSISTQTSETDTGYGRIENTDLYYDMPDHNHNWIPVKKDSWFGGISLWIRDLYVNSSDSTIYTSNFNIKDFYLLTDAIRAVAQKIDGDIQFDSLDSQFLFNSLNPLNGIQQGQLYISQKSNILNLGYDYPAWLAPVKWSQIETLLREAFDCYWSLYERNGQMHLRIEHRKWYENGGDYTQSGVQVASIDLTTTFRNGTPCTFGEKTRHWEFDTEGSGTISTASRHEYGWMDTQSEIFDGQPITVPGAYRLFTDEKVVQHKIDWFSSDIDFLTSVQAECSSDGFAIVMENPNQANWIITGSPQYGGQNYQLSFDYLQEKYLLQSIYAEQVQIGNNETLTNTGSNARMRTSEVQLRLPDGMAIEASDTIKTQVGIGVIDTLEYDLHSEIYTATLRYENE